MTNKDPYLALRIPEFRFFIIARFCIIVALQIQGVVVGWQMYEITNDPFALGLIGLAEAIPAIGVSLYAGHIADTVSRKKIISLCVGLLTICSATLLFINQINLTSLVGNDAIKWSLYGAIFMSGIARGFMGPALFAFMPQLLNNKTEYANAVSWNSTTWQTASVAGPALGGLIYVFGGLNASYSVDLGLMILALIIILFSISSKELPTQLNKEILTIKESITVGIKFIFENKIILSAISLDLFAVLFGGAVALLPVFCKDILHEGAWALGLLRAAPAVGSVIMALGIAYIPIHKKAGNKLLWAVAGFGVCMIGFAVSEIFWISFALLLLSGACDSISVIVRSTLLQTHTPEHMKGRVSAVNNIFIGSSNEIGSFESGLAAKLLGTVNSVIFGGCMTLIVAAITAYKAKELRELEL